MARAVTPEQAERISVAIDARAEELTIEEMARKKANLPRKATSYKIGIWFGAGVVTLLSIAALSVLGLLLFAAVRGVGRALGIW